MITKIIKGFLAYIAIAGTVTLSLFMMEEAFQTAMFGTWPAQDANQWQIVKDGSDIMAGINHTLRIVNNCAGWIQPLAFISYRAYAKSAEFYIASLRSKVFAHAPELFIGEEVEFSMTPQKTFPENDGAFGWWVIKSGKLLVLTDRQIPLGESYLVKETLQRRASDGALFFDLRD